MTENNELLCNVVMLSQGKEGYSKGDLLSTPFEEGLELLVANSICSYNSVWLAQHLYFTSYGEIKEGDWVIYQNREVVMVENCVVHPSFKVVASTDTSLGLPFIPEEWIRTKYAPSHGKITSVKLKREWASVLYPSTGQPDFDWCNDVLDIVLTDKGEVVIVDEKPWDFGTAFPSFNNSTKRKSNLSEEQVQSIMDEPSLGLHEEARIDEAMEEDDSIYEFTEKDLLKPVEQIAKEYGHSIYGNAVIYGAEWQRARSKQFAADEAIEFYKQLTAYKHSISDCTCDERTVEEFYVAWDGTFDSLKLIK